MIPASAPSPPSLSLQTYLQVVRRQRRLIVLVTLLTALFATLPAVLDDPVYRSSARVQVSALDEQGVFGEETAASLPSDRARDLATEMEILQSQPLRAAVLAEFPEDPPEFDDPEVVQVNFSEVVEITITAPEPDMAADVANAYASVFVDDRRERSVDALVAKSDELRSQSATATAELQSIGEQLARGGLAAAEVANLQVRQTALTSQVQDFNRRADELDVEAALRGRGTQVISPAQLELDPIKASPIRSAALGLVLGLLLALTIAVVADTAQDRIASREDLAGVRPDVPVLAAIPHADFEAAGGRGGFAVREGYRYLRTGVRVFGLNSSLRSVLLTSAVSDEGKSTTAVNLALAMAEAGDRVVLVDADLRRPTIHTRFGLPNDHGLSSVVVGDVPLDEVIHFVQDNLAIVPSGPPVQNPPEVLGSEQFANLINAIVEQADFTILDSPPVLPVADALLAGQQVDGVIVVSRIGGVRRRSVREMLGRLEEARIPLVGLVANDVSGAAPHGYYASDTTPPGDATVAPPERAGAGRG